MLKTVVVVRFSALFVTTIGFQPMAADEIWSMQSP